ncbi:hypothetical protein BH24CHL4_BH24CHL4_13320 [soil metagenome]
MELPRQDSSKWSNPIAASLEAVTLAAAPPRWAANQVVTGHVVGPSAHPADGRQRGHSGSLVVPAAARASRSPSPQCRQGKPCVRRFAQFSHTCWFGGFRIFPPPFLPSVSDREEYSSRLVSGISGNSREVPTCAYSQASPGLPPSLNLFNQLPWPGRSLLPEPLTVRPPAPQRTQLRPIASGQRRPGSDSTPDQRAAQAHRSIAG